jgi:hypothetical protein
MYSDREQDSETQYRDGRRPMDREPSRVLHRMKAEKIVISDPATPGLF